MKKSCLFDIISAIIFALVLSGCATTTQEKIDTKPGRKPSGYISDRNFQIIDVHNHLFAHYRSSSRIDEVDYEGAAKVALDAMNRLGIKRIFIMPPPFPPDLPGRYTYEDLIGTVKKYPDRFAFLGGGGTLNVMIQQAVRDGTTSPELRSRFEKTAMEIISKGALGFGELTAEHFSLHSDHPYESAPPDHSLFILLSDIAARHGVPIDIHMEAVPEDMPMPEIRGLESRRNPKMLRGNISAFERLLAHNRNTKIIWAHVGWCNTARRSPALCAELLQRHPNLYMSFKITRDSRPETRPVTRDFRLKPEWMNLISAYPERFVIGSDEFYATPKGNVRIGPPRKAEGTEQLLAQLPPELARKVGYENAIHLFNLKE